MKFLPGIVEHFPLIWVDLTTLFTLLPINGVFYIESLTNTLKFRWEIPVVGLSLTQHQQDYRAEMFKDKFHVGCSIIWTFQVLFNIWVICYHIWTPHHPKFYSTKKNKASIILHMIGGMIAVNGLYLGALLNIKTLCVVGAGGGFFLHLPSVIWHNRQTHGQRELSAPSYFMTWVLLLQAYVDIVMYDANFQTVFSCAMTLNIYSMVRFYYVLATPKISNLESSYDRTLFFAGFSNFPFCQGIFTPLYFLFGVHLWNLYFNLLKPFPKFMMRVERGYSDAIPNYLEKKRGVTFEEELNRQMAIHGDKKEAIAQTLWNILAEKERLMNIDDIYELYESWGMVDARSAAKDTFNRVDVDSSGLVDYEEFKIGFKILIDGIFLKGEQEDVYKQRCTLEKNEREDMLPK